MACPSRIQEQDNATKADSATGVFMNRTQQVHVVMHYKYIQEQDTGTTEGNAAQGFRKIEVHHKNIQEWTLQQQIFQHWNNQV